MDNEAWMPIEGYEGYYEVSNMGRVRAVPRIVRRGEIFQPVRERILSAGGDANKYPSVQLFKNGKGKRFTIHRLMAKAFIPNPNNLPEVDHINTIKNDNRIENLRWVSHKGNMRNPETMRLMREKAYNNEETLNKRMVARVKNGGKTAPKRIYQYDINGTFLKEWDNSAAVENALGFKRSNISSTAWRKGYAYNYLWSSCKEEMKKHAPYSVQKKRIIQLDMNGNYVREWESIKEAEQTLGVHSISRVLHGVKKSAGGFKWKFA